MRHLLTGVAVCTALAFSAPVWAQATSPGGNSMGMPGPNPGGPRTDTLHHGSAYGGSATLGLARANVPSKPSCASGTARCHVECRDRRAAAFSRSRAVPGA